MLGQVTVLTRVTILAFAILFEFKTGAVRGSFGLRQSLPLAIRIGWRRSLTLSFALAFPLRSAGRDLPILRLDFRRFLANTSGAGGCKRFRSGTGALQLTQNFVTFFPRLWETRSV